jgi:sugar-specific transcriptional regulator TrmB
MRGDVDMEVDLGVDVDVYVYVDADVNAAFTFFSSDSFKEVDTISVAGAHVDVSERVSLVVFLLFSNELL